MPCLRMPIVSSVLNVKNYKTHQFWFAEQVLATAAQAVRLVAELQPATASSAADPCEDTDGSELDLAALELCQQVSDVLELLTVHVRPSPVHWAC